jgi:hypothetical protein
MASTTFYGAANRLFIDTLNVAETGCFERVGGAGVF